LAARARRPRKTDCNPSTDFNLCAFEREYSIEAARPLVPVWSACPRLRAASRASGLRPSLTRPLTPSSPPAFCNDWGCQGSPAKIDSRRKTGTSCPGTEIARRLLRATRPRESDCDPSTDCHSCADEREYSIETPRRRCSSENSKTPPTRRQGTDPCLTGPPLHTRKRPRRCRARSPGDRHLCRGGGAEGAASDGAPEM
jgi:hypothetical protein